MRPGVSRKRHAAQDRGGAASEKLSNYLAGGPSRPAPDDGPRGVLPDTCAWIDYFRPGDGALASALDKALRHGSVYTCGPVVFELVQGVRTESEKSALLEALGSLEYCEIDPRIWITAGGLASVLRRRGRTLPFSDTLIAAVAIERGLALLTDDKHFRDIPGLTLLK